MPAFITILIVGIVLIVIGLSNIKGNIDSIHSYHKSRLAKEDEPIFAKLMSIGTLICGISVILFALLFLIGNLQNQPIFVNIGSYITIIGLAIGVGIMLYTTIKYNKGIF